MPREDLLTTDKKSTCKAEFDASSPVWRCSPRCAGAVRVVVRAGGGAGQPLWRPACAAATSSCSAGRARHRGRAGRDLPGRTARSTLGRIAARGGDTVTVTDTGALIINGSTVAEPDITTPTQPVEGGPDYPVTLAEGELFLLCDARTTGADSRLYGPIPQRQVLGTALAALRRSGL